MAENIQQEIASLEQQLAEKRASLEQNAAETDREVPHDKEILRDVVGEKIQQHAPSYQPTPTTHDDSNQSYNDPRLITQVQELVNMAFSKGIDNAVSSVVKSGNPALIDAFHDILVDQLYDTLVERKRLEPVK